MSLLREHICCVKFIFFAFFSADALRKVFYENLASQISMNRGWPIQDLGVYGKQRNYRLGIRYLHAEIWVSGISLFCLQLILDTKYTTFPSVLGKMLSIWGTSFRSPLGGPWMILLLFRIVSIETFNMMFLFFFQLD